MTPKKQAFQNLANTMIKNFKKRNIEAFYCEDSAAAVALAMDLMKDGGSVGMGGAETVKECGLLDAVKTADNLHFIDRNLATTPEEKKAVFLETMGCDYFLMSSNAVTIDGELINIDGNANRVACLAHGPEHVLVLIGMNKIVDDISTGIARVQNVASPANTIRLGIKTPCSVVGHCMDCHSENCICCEILITRHSKHNGRIKVLLIGEELGY